MTRTRVAVRGALLSAGAISVSTVSMLLVWKLGTNWLSASDFSLFLLLVVVSDSFNLLLNLALSVSLPRLLAAEPLESRPRLLSSVYAFQLAAGAAFFIVCLGVGLAARKHAGDAPSHQLLEVLALAPAIGALALVGMLRDITLAALAGLNLYGKRSIGIVVSGLSYVGLALLFLGPLGWGLGGLIAASLAAYTLNAAVGFRQLPFSPRQAQSHAALGAIRFSVPLYLNNLLSFASQRADTLIVSHALGLPGVAVFETAKRFPMLLSRGVGALLVPYLPSMTALIAENRQERAAEVFNQVLRLAIAGGYALVLAVAVFRESLVILIASAEYLAAADVLVLLMAATCLTVQCGLAGQGLIALGHTRIITLANTGMALTSLTLNLLLLPKLGLAGGGIAALAAILVSYPVQLLAVHASGLRVRWREYLSAQALFCVALAGMALAGEELLLRMLAFLLFLGGLWPCGVLRATDLRPLLHLRRRPR